MRKIRETRKSGFSVVISITGFAEPDEKYEPKKLDNGDILLKKREE